MFTGDTVNFSFKAYKELNYIPYFLKVYEADSLYLVKNYQYSYLLLDSLFKKFTPLNTEQYKEYETYIACAYVLNKKFAFKDSILNSIENYGSNSRYFKYDSLMNLAFKKAAITNEEILKSTQVYRSKLNFKLRDSIQKMVVMDQEVRNGEIDFAKMRIVDSLNQVKLQKIINQYGYPHEKLIGEFYIDSVFTDLGVIFLHTNNDFRMNYLLPNVLKAVKKGEAYPEKYAQPYDRYLDYTTGKQLYGCYTLINKYKDIISINTVKIDSIRKSVGLPSPTYKTWRFNVRYAKFLKKENN